MRSSGLAACFLALALLASCTDEATTPIDLEATTTTVVSPDTTAVDANAEERARVEEFAKEECRKDPTREFGVVVFSDAETGEEVSRFEFPCADLED